MAREGTFVPASSVLQDLHDQVPAGPVTLQWLMDRLRHQSFGMIVLILGIAAMAPGVSIVAGLLLLGVAFQMMIGLPRLRFPDWLATRELPARRVGPLMQHVIPVLVWLEKAVHPRLTFPPEATKRVVGVVVFVLTVRLLVAPLPLSNILPAILIAVIALTYLEEDGLMLIAAVLAGCLFLVAEFGVLSMLHNLII